ncbi:MAG: vWA domain-containing protein [Planctomycetota bacterium]|jgi:predicted metal-dependent peptidase
MWIDRKQSTLAAEKLHAAVEAMLQKYPYHAALLAFDLFVEDALTGTMGVTTRGGRVCYRYAPSFVCGISHEELQGVVHHEINHFLFGHVLLDPEEYPDRRARTVAAEVTVNEWVPEPLPGKPIRLADFPDLPPGEDTATRYERLAGRTDLPSDLPVDNHATWDPGAGLSPWDSRIDELLARGFGRGPRIPSESLRSLWGVGGPMEARREQLRSAGEPRKPIDWSRVLRAEVGASARQRATFSRPPRRLPHLTGVIPADVIHPKKPKVMTVIDTSGSMDAKALSRVAAELSRIRRFADVIVVECDKKVRARYRFRSALKEVHGRGGTDLRPALEHEFLRKDRPRAVIYFTDGHGPAPTHPPRVPVIWCLTPGGVRPAEWGRTVRMAA